MHDSLHVVSKYAHDVHQTRESPLPRVAGPVDSVNGMLDSRPPIVANDEQREPHDPGDDAT